MKKYRLDDEDFKGVIVDAETKGEAISKLIPLLKEAKKNDPAYEWFFVNDKNTRIHIHLTSKRWEDSPRVIGNGESEVEEVSDETLEAERDLEKKTLEKEKALKEERKRIADFCAIPAKEIRVSDVCDYFGKNWYTMTLYGQTHVAQHISDATGVDFAITFEWVENILERWN